jgi:1,4-alpha-glucan branching enzyme
MRRAASGSRFLIVVCNFTPVVREHYRIGVPCAGEYREVFNSDREAYGGSGRVNCVPLQAGQLWWHNQPFSLQLTLPPLAVIYLEAVH